MESRQPRIQTDPNTRGRLTRRSFWKEESKMLWARLLAYVTGTVNQELLLRNEYLAAENRILRGQIKGRLLLSEEEKATLAEIARYLLHDRDTKFCQSFRELLKTGDVNPLRLPARSPNL